MVLVDVVYRHASLAKAGGEEVFNNCVAEDEKIERR